MMFEKWIASNLEDRDVARRSRLLNVLTLFLLVGALGFLVVGLIVWAVQPVALKGWVVGLVVGLVAVLVVTYVQNRRGRFTVALWMLMATLNGIFLVVLLGMGHRSAAPMLVPVAILVWTLLVGRSALFWSTLFWLMVVSVLATAEMNGAYMPFFVSMSDGSVTEMALPGTLLGIGLVGVLGWLVAGHLVAVLAEARDQRERALLREEELERARASIELQVRERTRDLENALADVQQSMVEQERVLAALRRQAIPVVPLLHQVIALPVIGFLDAERAEQLLTDLLDGVQQFDARIVLLDITGVPVIDEAAAQGVVEIIAGARLVGAECVLVGVRPDIASKLIDLDLDLASLTSRVDMEAGIRYALQRLGRTLRSE